MTTAETAAASARPALAAAQHLRLPFGRQAWRGQQGNWLGAGLGSSIDFQDHRDYVPGDDPRYIHWAAFARTGQLTMKLFRAEVAPLVDLAVDLSASMTFTPAKAARTDELVAFCVRSADQAGAPVRIHAFDGTKIRAMPLEWLRAGRWRDRLPPPATPSSPAAMPAPLPWRPGAMKVLVSDLLFPGEPSSVLGPLATGSGLALILAPAVAAERDLPARGNIELLDCEGGPSRHQRIDDALAARYREAYRRHFALWDDAARQRGVVLATVPAEGELKDALAGEPLRRGAVEHRV
ncbi:MAG TPA: DUF58 domain-containing protein [Lacunisphaera sp.]|nr:DUF58 domain-containing protein [Lacunisphaera sp.]